LYPVYTMGVTLLSRFRKRTARKGMTILEVLLVVVLIVLMMGVLASKMDITSIFAKSHDSQRTSDARQLENALYQQLVKEWENANENQIPEGEDNAMPICVYEAADTTGCIVMDDLIDNDYLPAMPNDPIEGNLNFSGYKVYKDVGRSRIISTHLGE